MDTHDDMQWEGPQPTAPAKRITISKALDVLYGISDRGYLDSPRIPSPRSEEIESVVSAVFHAILTLDARSMIIKDLKSELTDALAQVKYLTTQRDSVFDEMKRLESELDAAKACVRRMVVYAELVREGVDIADIGEALTQEQVGDYGKRLIATRAHVDADLAEAGKMLGRSPRRVLEKDQREHLFTKIDFPPASGDTGGGA